MQCRKFNYEFNADTFFYVLYKVHKNFTLTLISAHIYIHMCTLYTKNTRNVNNVSIALILYACFSDGQVVKKNAKIHVYIYMLLYIG